MPFRVSTIGQIKEQFRITARWMCRSISPFLEMKQLFVVMKALKIREDKDSYSIKTHKANEKILKGL